MDDAIYIFTRGPTRSFIIIYADEFRNQQFYIILKYNNRLRTDGQLVVPGIPQFLHFRDF